MNNALEEHQDLLSGSKELLCSAKVLLKKLQNKFISKVKPSGFKFSIFDSVEFVSDEVWNSVNYENNIFLSTAYLSALEMAPPENMAFKYAILYEGNKPAAIVYFQILTLDARLHDPLTLNETDNKAKLSDKVHSKVKERISTKMLICGNVLLSGEHGFASIPGTDQSKLSKGISEVVERIRQAERICGKVNIVLIKDFYTEKIYNKAVFSDAGYYDYFAGPNMVVQIRENWASFDDYLADMKAKYRKRVNSALKKAGGMVRKSLSYEGIVANKDELYRLYLQVADKAKFRLFLLNPGMLQELKRSLGDKFVLDAYYLNDKIIAYTTRIFNGDVMEGYSHGLDYSHNKAYDIYQNILIDDIKEGIESKTKKINFGRTSIAMKSSLGAVPEDMQFLMQFKVVIPNPLIKKIACFFKPSDEHCRNPFE